MGPAFDQPPLNKQITFEVNNGTRIPGVGLGTWRSEPGKLKEVITYALEEAEYRHIDCAANYGNEEEVGSALQEVFAKGRIKREDVWVTSKLWITHTAPEHVELDYLDLYLIHWPITLHPGCTTPNKPDDFKKVDMEATWHKLEEMVGKGKAKAIGISNFSVEKTENLLRSALIVPAVNQIEAHPGWRNEKIVKFCESKGIHPSAYSPLGSQDSEFEDPEQGKSTKLLEHSVITRIAQKLNKEPGQVMLRWNLQRGLSVLPKSTSPTRIKQNMDLFGWELSPADMDELNTLEPQQKVFSELHVGKEGSPYKTKEELWDGEI